MVTPRGLQRGSGAALVSPGPGKEFGMLPPVYYPGASSFVVGLFLFPSAYRHGNEFHVVWGLSVVSLLVVAEEKEGER